MNPNMNGTIRRLTSTFIVLFLLISGVAAYIQIGNQAFYNGPVLAHGQYDTNPDRNCPPYDAPVRGTIYDRNGVKLAWSVPDPNDPCIYIRKYDPRVYTSGLAPLLGYYSQQYGAAGLEASFNDQLAGVNSGESVGDVVSSLLHKPRYGDDIYLTIDINLQVQMAANFRDVNGAAGTVAFGGVCQVFGTDPPGSMIAEDPNTGEILAMVSWPSFDPNKIDQPGYFQQVNGMVNSPFLNHATQALYTPGSIFKTVTLAAAIDSGQATVDTQFDKQNAVYFQVPQGEEIQWYDYLNGYPAGLKFPITLQDGYAYSDNVLYAREAVQMGGATWLSYVRKFGIQEPGFTVPSVPFDGPQRLSAAYNDLAAQQAMLGNAGALDLLAESGFGQGQLFITPLTMTEVSSTMASSNQNLTLHYPVGSSIPFASTAGTLYEPHSVLEIVPHQSNPQIQQIQPVAFGGGPILRPTTTQAVRQAMWAVSSYGTGSTVANPQPGASYSVLKNSPVPEGGKTGTAQGDQANPQTWWISLAPDDAANGQPAQLAITLMKQNSGEGACQVFVTDHTYVWAQQQGIIPVDKP